MTTTKTCSKCKITKYISEFSRDSSRPNGLSYVCKTCVKLKSKNHYLKNIERERANKVRWKKENGDKNKNINKLYKESHKIKIKEYHIELYKKNRERILKVSKKYYQNNKHTVNERHKTYNKTERGKISLANSRNKRRVMRNLTYDGTLPKYINFPLSKDLQTLLKKQNYKCNNCSADLNEGKHLDHHTPLSKGGKHSITNVVWLCPTCNVTKSDKMPSKPLSISIF